MTSKPTWPITLWVSGHVGFLFGSGDDGPLAVTRTEADGNGHRGQEVVGRRGLGLVLVIVLILLLMGYIPRGF